jgi:hypothetical protein
MNAVFSISAKICVQKILVDNVTVFG